MTRKKKYASLFSVAAAATVAITAVPGITSAAQFSDIQGDTHEAAIIQLVDMKIINGYPDGTFKPYKELTRSDVVKLVGRYLTKNGYKVPADYQTNFRFSDLSSDTDNELLQYAALVKDAGIFTGEQLQPLEAMTREDMAVVLVNALSNIHQFDFHAYVNEQPFEKKVTDLNNAKESARSSINVLDYFDITKVSEFKPKDSLTRGQFASFLQRLTNVEYEDVFQVKNVEQSETQLIVQFNKVVDLPTTTDAEEIANYFTLSGVNKEVFTKGELSEDGRTYTLTLNNKAGLDGKYQLTIQEVRSMDRNILPKYEQQVHFEKIEEKPAPKPNPGEDKEETRFVVESDPFVLGVTPNGQIVHEDDANIKVFGFINDAKVELPSAAYTITSTSNYLTINGNKVTANRNAIEADGILDDDNETYEVEIIITINQTGEQIKHTLILSSEEVKAHGKFKLIDKNSISKKELKTVYVEVPESKLELTATDLFEAIDDVGIFEIEDQYGAEAIFNPGTGQVTFADGSSRDMRPIITEINTTNDDYTISANGTLNVRIGLGENGLSRGDSFMLKLSIDEATLSVKVYLR